MPRQKADKKLKMAGALVERRRPCKLLAISGEYVPEVVTQETLESARGMQDAMWFIATGAVKKAQTIAAAIARGARVEPGEYYFDPSAGRVEKRD